MSCVRSAAALAGLALSFSCLFTAGSALAADPKPAPPPLISTNAAREDIDKLRETVRQLDDRLAQQERTLVRISEIVSGIAKRVEDDLKPSAIAETNKGVAALLIRIRDLQEAVGNDARLRDQRLAELADSQRVLLAELKSLDARLAELDRTNTEAVDKLRGDVAKSRAPAAAPAPAADAHDVGPALIGVAAGCTLLLGLLILLQGRAQRRSADATRVELINNLVQVRDALLASAITPPPITALSRTTPAPSEPVSAPPTSPSTAVHHDDHTTQPLPPHFADDTPTVPHLPPASLPSGLATPDSPLASWRAELGADLAAGMPELRKVLGCWERLVQSCTPPHPKAIEPVASAVDELSQALHAYWDAKPALTEDDRVRASADWIKAVKALAIPAVPKLEIREIVPGSRFDSDSMQTVREGPGNHLNVAHVYSWVVLDRSGERARIVQRARIATT